MVPDKFFIKAAAEGKFETLEITRCQHGVYLDEFRPRLIVPTAPEEVAESICFDYKKGCLQSEAGVAEPALFWVDAPAPKDESEHSVFRATFNADFNEAIRMQQAWFIRLVEEADDLWEKFKRQGMVSQVHKIAAMRLKLTNKAWLVTSQVEAALSECPTCFEKVNPRAIICRSCNAVLKPEEYKKVQFAAPRGADVKTLA